MPLLKGARIFLRESHLKNDLTLAAALSLNNIVSMVEWTMRITIITEINLFRKSYSSAEVTEWMEWDVSHPGSAY